MFAKPGGAPPETRTWYLPAGDVPSRLTSMLTPLAGSTNGPAEVQQLGGGGGGAEDGIVTVTSTNFVTPLALVLVNLKVKVPGEGEGEAMTARVADAEAKDCGGMLT